MMPRATSAADRRRALLGAMLGMGALTLVGQSSAADDEIVVIVATRSPIERAERDDLRPVFLTTRSQWSDGSRVTPLNIKDDHKVRQRFDEVVLGMSADEVKKYWTDRKIRGGARPPRRLPNEGAIVRAVADDPSAVGYVRRRELTAAVRVIAVLRGGKVVAG